MKNELHVVFGAGQVGFFLAKNLLEAGKRVRIVKRNVGGIPDGCELMLGDALDLAVCRRACTGATVVYHCINPEYSAKVWGATLLPLMDNLIAAAGEANARLVVLDNVYMLGRTGGKPMNENIPNNPCSKKGEIRAYVAERLMAAQRLGNVQAVCGRAADFYGPRGTLTLFGDFFWKAVLNGRPAILPANLDMVHTYHYIPDVARGLVQLGCASESELSGNPVWMLPCQPAVTTRELAERFSLYLEKPVHMKKMSNWVLKPLGLFIPIMRELGEMTYQWDEPFIIDDSRFRKSFDVALASVSEAAMDSVKWAQKSYVPNP
jgi:nucleoside-diphosphate-sugar epimerase